MAIFSYLIPNSLDPTTLMVLDTIVYIHLAVFVVALCMLIIDCMKKPVAIFASGENNKQEREQFLSKLE